MSFDETDQRQAMLAAIIDSSDDAIISKDLSSRVTSWNKAAENMFGYTEKEMIGERIHILIPPHLRSEEEMIISQLKEGKRVQHFQTVRLTKDGRQLQVSLTISPVKDATGRVVGASKIARDITRQKEDEALLRQYAKRLEIIDSVGKQIASSLDVQTILQSVTDATTSLCGAAFGAFFYNRTNTQGESFMLYTLSGAPREAFEKFGTPRNTEVFKQTFEGSAVVRSDDITADPRYGKNPPHNGMPKGHLPVVSYLAVPVRSQVGIVIGGLFFGHPERAKFLPEQEHLVSAIAGQAAIALDNAKLYEEVRHLNSQKDQFIGFASHELKTPLTTISGYVQLARQTDQLPPGFIEKLHKQVSRLEIIVSDLLDMSRIAAGRLDLHFTRASINNLVRDSIEAINIQTHTVVTELLSEDITVNVDIQKISQVLLNLLSNAIKYSDDNTTIRVTAERLGDEIEITIADQGIGIASTDIENIFNQFYRVNKRTNAPGIGLGLYITRQIVEAHSGRIWAESEEGVGSVFHVLFPIDRKTGV